MNNTNLVELFSRKNSISPANVTFNDELSFMNDTDCLVLETLLMQTNGELSKVEVHE